MSSQEENHDHQLDLTLSLSLPRRPPETQPSVSVPVPVSDTVLDPVYTEQTHQGMLFPAPDETFFLPLYPFLAPQVLIPSHQHHHNNDQGQPSSSRRARVPVVVSPGPSRKRQRRVSKQESLSLGKSLDILPPHPWAAPRRAHVRSLDELLSERVTLIKGQVQCKTRGMVYSIEFDLRSKFMEVAEYIRHNKYDMLDRAPDVWKNPVLPSCRECESENCAKPVAEKKRTTNWLFLLLGQMLGCCTIKQLKYFCKHTMNHRTGAKDRLLYLTYMGLCKQLDPNGPFDV